MQQQEIIKIYRDNVERVYRFFYKRTFSKEVSEDLTSECFHILLEKLNSDKGNSKIQLAESYIIGIAKHVLFGYLRRKYSENLSQIEDIDDFADDDSQSEFEEDNETVESYTQILENRLLDLIPKLPDAQREVITLRFVKRLTLTEIATKLKKDMNYVKVTQRRAIAKLKELAELTKSV